MLELRIKLPYLSNKHPDIERLKQEIRESVVLRGQVPSYAISIDIEMISIVDDETKP